MAIRCCCPPERVETLRFAQLDFFSFLNAVFAFYDGFVSFQAQTERYVLVNVHMGEQSVLLKYRVYGALIGRELAYVLSVQQNFA